MTVLERGTSYLLHMFVADDFLAQPSPLTSVAVTSGLSPVVTLIDLRRFGVVYRNTGEPLVIEGGFDPDNLLESVLCPVDTRTGTCGGLAVNMPGWWLRYRPTEFTELDFTVQLRGSAVGSRRVDSNTISLLVTSLFTLENGVVVPRFGRLLGNTEIGNMLNDFGDTSLFDALSSGFGGTLQGGMGRVAARKIVNSIIMVGVIGSDGSLSTAFVDVSAELEASPLANVDCGPWNVGVGTAPVTLVDPLVVTDVFVAVDRVAIGTDRGAYLRVFSDDSSTTTTEECVWRTRSVGRVRDVSTWRQSVLGIYRNGIAEVALSSPFFGGDFRQLHAMDGTRGLAGHLSLSDFLGFDATRAGLYGAAVRVADCSSYGDFTGQLVCIIDWGPGEVSRSAWRNYWDDYFSSGSTADALEHGPVPDATDVRWGQYGRYSIVSRVAAVLSLSLSFPHGYSLPLLENGVSTVLRLTREPDCSQCFVWSRLSTLPDIVSKPLIQGPGPIILPNHVVTEEDVADIPDFLVDHGLTLTDIAFSATILPTVYAFGSSVLFSTNGGVTWRPFIVSADSVVSSENEATYDGVYFTAEEYSAAVLAGSPRSSLLDWHFVGVGARFCVSTVGVPDGHTLVHMSDGQVWLLDDYHVEAAIRVRYMGATATGVLDIASQLFVPVMRPTASNPTLLVAGAPGWSRCMSWGIGSSLFEICTSHAVALIASSGGSNVELSSTTEALQHYIGSIAPDLNAGQTAQGSSVLEALAGVLIGRTTADDAARIISQGDRVTSRLTLPDLGAAGPVPLREEGVLSTWCERGNRIKIGLDVDGDGADDTTGHVLEWEVFSSGFASCYAIGALTTEETVARVREAPNAIIDEATGLRVGPLGLILTPMTGDRQAASASLPISTPVDALLARLVASEARAPLIVPEVFRSPLYRVTGLLPECSFSKLEVTFVNDPAFTRVPLVPAEPLFDSTSTIELYFEAGSSFSFDVDVTANLLVPSIDDINRAMNDVMVDVQQAGYDSQLKVTVSVLRDESLSPFPGGFELTRRFRIELEEQSTGDSISSFQSLSDDSLAFRTYLVIGIADANMHCRVFHSPITVSLIAGCPRGREMYLDVDASVKLDPLCTHNPSIPCFFFDDGFDPVLRIRDSVTGSVSDLTVAYRWEIIASGPAEDDLTMFDADELAAFNLGSAPIYAAPPDAADSTSSVIEPGDGFMSWLCAPGSPCGSLSPVFPRTTEIYFLVRISTENIASPSFCTYQTQLVIRLHGIAIDFQTIIITLLATLGILCVFVGGIYVWYVIVQVRRLRGSADTEVMAGKSALKPTSTQAEAESPLADSVNAILQRRKLHSQLSRTGSSSNGLMTARSEGSLGRKQKYA